ncbi:hypothetical protein E2562_033627 [Oryza meyeriana var. granulata]|uniref:Uncharacterized protein n=1 Tax=Oryza meyeriana var. granulata TaxID=110450 RepID=A0A6G1CAF2_9ORYZ|nr:hypothetical protein E2562_033627 [Oryza meyeriana var. granulata]
MSATSSLVSVGEEGRRGRDEKWGTETPEPTHLPSSSAGHIDRRANAHDSTRIVYSDYPCSWQGADYSRRCANYPDYSLHSSTRESVDYLARCAECSASYDDHSYSC